MTAADIARANDYQRGLDSCIRTIALAEPDKKPLVFRNMAMDVRRYVHSGGIEKGEAVDRLYDAALSHGVVAILGENAVQAILAEAMAAPVPQINFERKETSDTGEGSAQEFCQSNSGLKFKSYAEMNEHFSVVRYGSKIVIAEHGFRLEFISVDDFHRMFANQFITVKIAHGGTKRTSLSKGWFTWDGRRQYLNPGVVFEPGGKDEPGKLNLWRGFAVKPKSGKWSLLRDHIYTVVCSGNQDHFDYLLKWLAYGVQHPDKPIGVAVALRGAQGAGKGVLFRTYGELFGQHFVHITQGSQLIGRFNASLGNSVAVFLDEALWAADRQGEGVLKALITEPTLQLEAKFRDPITVPNYLRIMIASNSDWFVPVGVGDRRFFVLDVDDTYAGTGHKEYWDALYGELDHGGRAAMLYDLMAIDLSGFDVRAIPDSAAKTEQKLHSLRGIESWLAHVLQERSIGQISWTDDGLSIDKQGAYENYVTFSKERHEWKPEVKSVWARTLRQILKGSLKESRPGSSGSRQRMLVFRPQTECRKAFEVSMRIGAGTMAWEEND